MTLFGDRRSGTPAGRGLASDDDATFWTSLAHRIKEGDREAETEFAVQFYVRVRPMASVCLQWSDAAVDVAQETILAALEGLRAGRLREPERLPAFVLGIARNLINNYRRRQGQSREVQDDPPDRPVQADPTLTRLDEQQRALVRASLKRLNRVDRRILLLTLADGMSPREIAPIVGLKPEVVRTRKSRAVKTVADAIAGMTRTRRANHVPERDRTS